MDELKEKHLRMDKNTNILLMIIGLCETMDEVSKYIIKPSGYPIAIPELRLADCFTGAALNKVFVTLL